LLFQGLDWVWFFGLLDFLVFYGSGFLLIDWFGFRILVFAFLRIWNAYQSTSDTKVAPMAESVNRDYALFFDYGNYLTGRRRTLNQERGSTIKRKRAAWKCCPVLKSNIL
jgi:hypothetical protein